jgi:hypothetical protein
LFQLDQGSAHFKWQEDIRKRIGQRMRNNTLLKPMNVTKENSWWNIPPVENEKLETQTPAGQCVKSGTRIFCVQVPILEIAA